MMTLTVSTSFFVKSVFKDFGVNMVPDDEYLTILAEAGFLFATFSRFAFGALFD